MLKKNEEELVVYWAPYESKDRQYTRLLIDKNLKNLMHDIIQRKEKDPIIPNSNNLQTTGYQSCTALHQLVKNTYILPSSLDLEIYLNINGEIIRNNSSAQYFTERVSSFKNSFAIDLNLGILLFSEESVNIELTHPYMNQTSYTNSAFLISAEYDISSWLRPVALIYHLWENVRNFNVLEDEPLAYIKFKTDKKIVFKRFEITNKIENQVHACIDHKFIKPFEPLEKLYNRFLTSGMKKSVLREIQKNIID